MGVLRNHKYERLAQLVAGGKTIVAALKECGYRETSGVCKKPIIADRIAQLMQQGANRAALSREKILERIMEDWDQARKLGQISAGLKAAEMLGKEVFKMFVDRREIGGPGDFDNKTEAELREFIANEMRELGLDMELSDETGSTPVNGNGTIN